MKGQHSNRWHCDPYTTVTDNSDLIMYQRYMSSRFVLSVPFHCTWVITIRIQTDTTYYSTKSITTLAKKLQTRRGGMRVPL